MAKWKEITGEELAEFLSKIGFAPKPKIEPRLTGNIDAETIRSILAGEAQMAEKVTGEAPIAEKMAVGEPTEAPSGTGKDPYVSTLLNRLSELYAERNAVYKDNYLKVGGVMSAMFPDGMVLKTAEDFNRWHLFELAIVKLTRYVNQYEAGGHPDSIEDMIVYLSMVAGLDNAAAEKP
jgi:hypothetical protein